MSNAPFDLVVPADSAPYAAHVITRLDKGGSATNTLVSADRLRACGFRTKLIYGSTNDPDGSIARALASADLDAVCMPCLTRAIAPIRDGLALLRLFRLFRKERFDLIHTHTSKAGLLGRIAARLAGIPCVHTPHGHVFYGYFGPALTRLFVWLERRAARFTRRIVSLTDKETAESLERGIGKSEQYVTIPSGVPLDRFRNLPAAEGEAFRARHGIPADATLIVSVGRLTAVKGFDLLLRAVARISGAGPGRELWLAIAGDGEERSALEALARDVGVADRTVFAGHRDDIRDLLSAGDLFALASRNEGMGRAFIEAMAAGLPVAGTRTGGVPIVVRHGETGLLAEKENVAGLADALQRLATDEPLRRAMGRRAAQWVWPTYDESTMIKKLAELYRAVLA